MSEPRAIYAYNVACRCDWCENAGRAPSGTSDNGHGFGYTEPHNPPGSRAPWAA